MLSNLSQYSPQGLLPQFPGLQTAGSPQMTPGLFGQPGAYNGHAQFGHESGQAWQTQQFPQSQQFPFGAHPVGAHQGVNSQSQQIPVQQIVPLLAQLAQQIAVQSVVAQQIGAAVHHLTHQLATQLATQGPQGHPGGGFGAGQAFGGPQPFGGPQAFGGHQPFAGGGGAQPFGSAGPLLGTPGAQYFGPNSFNTPQGGYGGFNPQQGQAWGANRPQTIQ
jgi:hypothetical protein